MRLIAWAAVAALALFTLAGFAWRVLAPQPATTQSADIGGPFTLVDQTGKTVTEKDLAGSPSLLFFGYTHCPDICPTTLADLTTAMGQLGGEADRIKVFFTTVDPERDTEAVMAQYAQAFDPRFHLLTGTRPQIDAMLHEYKVFSQKVGEGDDYTMNHSAGIYLLDSKGHFAGTMSDQEGIPKMVGKMKKLIEAS